MIKAFHLFLKGLLYWICLLLSSGNRTPGSRSYSDLLDTLADSVAFTYSYSSVVQSARLLVPINAHVT